LHRGSVSLKRGKKSLSENNSHLKNMKYVCVGGQTLNKKGTSLMHGHERDYAKR
jgi:galactose-1-phosphate uridylyltransferase